MSSTIRPEHDRHAALSERGASRAWADDSAFDTDVLVIGSGPTGSTAALAMARYGIRARVVTKWNWLANGPRAHITNQRAMEVLRDLGVEERATAVAVPWDLMGDMVFMTSVAGTEVARMRAFGTGEDRASDYRTGSPCPMLDIPQPLLEPILVDAAAAAGANYSFNTEYLSHAQDDEGVATLVRDRLSRHEYTIRSRYLLGADGAGSKVAEDIGLPIEGQMGRAATMYTVFSADLARYVEDRPSMLHWILNPEVGYGEIGMATLRSIRPWNLWIAGWGYDLAGDPPDTSPSAVLPVLRTLIGDPTVDIEIHSTNTWRINQAWATYFSSGRVFCGGDAVHRHPPSGGLGSNTCIQDAFNLAWKFAYVVKGWAGESLLATYTDERAPVGKQIVARANQSRVDYQPIADLFRDTDGDDPIGAGLARLRDPGAEGVTVRASLNEALLLKNTEHNAQGTELNHRYESAAVIPDEPAATEVWHRDPGLYLQATTRPGAKIPHVWLTDDAGRKVSTLDVTGRGMFTLMTGPAGTCWRAAADALDLPWLRTVVVGASGAHDSYFAWHRAREIDEAGCLLVRPDGYVAWRHATGVGDVSAAVTQLRSALDRVLGATS